MKKVLAILFSCFFVLNSFADGSNKFILNNSTRNYDQQHIRLDLRFDFAEKAVKGEATLQVTPLVGDFDTLILHAETMTISSVKSGRCALRFSQEDGLLKIKLDRKYRPGEIVRTTINYTAKPDRGLYFFSPGKDIPDMPYQIWSQGEGQNNRYWFPCFDSVGDKMTTEINVTVPANLRVISNGTLAGITEDKKRDEKTFHWRMDQEQAAYLVSIVVGDYVTISDTVRGVPLHYNIPAHRKNENTDLVFGHTPAMISFFSDYICPYPYEKYDQTPVQDFKYGGMENISATTLNSRVFHDERAVPNYSPDALIAHELAHQWFGDLLTIKEWPHIWLQEGFATYFTDLFFEHEYGTDEFRMRRFRQNRSLFTDRKVKAADAPFTPVDLSGRTAYSRGAAILNMLRYELGDNVFQKGIQYYVDKFKFKSVDSEDFRLAMQEASGRDLGQFFKQWIYGAGHPKFQVFWEWTESSKTMALHVKQTQDENDFTGIFQITVPLEITAGRKKMAARLPITSREHTFRYRLPQKPDLVRFDKGYWILKELAFKKSFSELSYQLLNDDDVTGRYRAAEQLIDFNDRAIPVLRHAFYRELFYAVRARIVKSLGEIKSREALAILKTAADDPDARVRAEAMSALAQFDAQDVQRILKNHFYQEKNDYVRAAAVAALGKVKADEVYNVIKDALQTDSHRNVIRRNAYSALVTLKDAHGLPLAAKHAQYNAYDGNMHLLDIAALDYAKAMADEHHNEAIAVITGALKNPYFRTRIHVAKLLSDLNVKKSLPQIKETLKNVRRIEVKNALDKAIQKLSQ